MTLCAYEKAIETWYRREYKCTGLESSLLGRLSRSSRLLQQPLLATVRDSGNLSRDGLGIRGLGRRHCLTTRSLFLWKRVRTPM